MHSLDQNFWLAVSFIIFLYFAYKPVKRAILNSLDAKIGQVKVLVEEAENLKKDAQELLFKTQNEIKNLDDLRSQILGTAREDSSVIAQSRTRETEELLEQKKKDALSSIEHHQLNAFNNIKQDFARLTTTLVEEYLKETSNNNLSDLEIAMKFMPKEKPDL